MGKDFAQSNHGGRQTRSGAALPGRVWLLLGIAIGLVCAAGYYISRPALDAQNASEAPDGKSKTAGKKKIAIPPKEPSRFAFYELLPSYEVVIPKESLKPETKSTGPATAGEPGNRFMIQVGSFQDRKEAEQQKANLALLGIESRVEQVTIDNKQTWYRVRVGPEKDPERVQNIMARLEENEIKALVMRVPE
ncbi:MAG: SPOR domain-containing protein [Hydrocarboniphaga effusa]|nr:SPOR domain-containing protein [Hydrocarboniphaga effusa]